MTEVGQSPNDPIKGHFRGERDLPGAMGVHEPEGSPGRTGRFTKAVGRRRRGVSQHALSMTSEREMPDRAVANGLHSSSV